MRAIKHLAVYHSFLVWVITFLSGQIGWVTATAKLTPNDNSGDNLNTNVNGYLLGLGVKHLFTKNVYGFAEANYIGYSAGSATAADSFPDGQVTSLGYTNTPTSYNFLVGVGYKF
jgi:opacity protein-like surface antigen